MGSGYGEIGYGGGMGRSQGYGSFEDTGRHGRSGRGTPPRSYKRTDDRIMEDVCERLMDEGLDCGNVEVTVVSGVVTFTGDVREREDKHRIERIAENISGVQDVDNKLKLSKKSGSESGSSGSGSSFGSGSSYGSGSTNYGSTKQTETSSHNKK